MTIRQYFTRLPRWSRTGLVLSVTAGIALTTGGWLLDHEGFWKDNGFLLNLATSFVAAFFGIPLAIVGLGWFSNTQADRLARRKAERLTRNAWDDLEHAVLTYTPKEVIDVLERQGRSVIAAHDAILAAQDGIGYDYDRSTTYPTPILTCTPEQEEAAMKAVAVAVEDLRRAFDEVRIALDPWRYNTREWMSIRSKWQFLSTDVRIQRASEDLDWMDPESNKSLTFRFHQSSSPVTSVHEVIEGRARNYVDELDKALKTSDLMRVVAIVRRLDSGAPALYVDNYEQDCIAAAVGMSELRGATLAVKETGWPIRSAG